MKNKIKKFSIGLILLVGLISAVEVFAAADLEVTQVGRNVTRSGAYGTLVIANAGTETILINVDVRNIGDTGTTASTTFSAALPAEIEYVANSSKYFSMACGNFTSGCAIADSATGTAFPFDDPYALGALAAGDDLTIQYKVKITAGTQTGATIEGANITDGVITASGAALTATPDLPPVITLNGSSTINLFVGQTYSEPGATAIDETEGSISGNIVIGGIVNTAVPATYTRTYNVSDSSGNAAIQKTRTIIVSLDTIKPVITLTGSSTITLTVGDSYADAGATALDNLDGDISAGIITSTTLTTSITGTYAVTYNVTDAAGNAAIEVIRTVIVNDIPAPPAPPVVVVQSGGGGGGGGGSAPTPQITTNSSVVINSNAAVTNIRAVTLSLQAINAIQMMIGNDANFTGSAWEPYATIKAWTLTQGDEVKTVYAKFRDIGNNVAGPVSDTIQLVTGAAITNTLSVTAEYSFTQDLAFGNTGSEVTELQNRLAKEGFYSGATTNSFDSKTLDAVKAYQKANNIVATGYVGSTTRAKLNKEETSGTPAPVSGLAFARNLTLGMRGDDVRELQLRLTEAGVYNGPVTGYFGNLTLAAVKKYQLAKNILPRSGFVGPLTRLALNTTKSAPPVQNIAEAPTSSAPVIVQAPTPTNKEETQKKINALQAQLLTLMKLLEDALTKR